MIPAIFWVCFAAFYLVVAMVTGRLLMRAARRRADTRSLDDGDVRFGVTIVACLWPAVALFGVGVGVGLALRALIAPPLPKRPPDV